MISEGIGQWISSGALEVLCCFLSSNLALLAPRCLKMGSNGALMHKFCFHTEKKAPAPSSSSQKSDSFEHLTLDSGLPHLLQSLSYNFLQKT